MINKIETLEEYLARGGSITHIPIVKQPDKKITVKSTSTAPHIPIDLTTGAHFFAEHIRRNRKIRKFMGDITLLPPDLVKFLKERGQL